MPNGMDVSAQEWARISEPLEVTDSAWRRLASRVSSNLRVNYHGMPRRSVMWGRGLERRLELYLSDQAGPEFSFSAELWSRGGDPVRSKSLLLASGLTPEQLETEVEGLIEQGLELVEGWTESDLEDVYTDKHDRPDSPWGWVRGMLRR